MFAVGCLMFFASSSGWAQQKQKYVSKGVPTTKYVEQHAIDVGDVPGHQIRVARLQTTYADDSPAFDGVKVVGSSASLSSDYIDGSGRFVVYAVLLMA
ncbi:MAG TPA: hypothetical protein VGO18_08525, partial [Steroidobacteraceae bacterium]|nr:hypothetical protein [Steroidobacteraceae bacterium]